MRRRDFLRASLTASLLPLFGGTAWSDTEKPIAKPRLFENLFVVMLPGGWDTTYIFEPKPDNEFVYVPEGEIGVFGNLELWVSDTRPLAKKFFEKYHSISTVVNGVQVRSVAHLPCTRRMLTGKAAPGFPDFASIIGHDLSPEFPVSKLALGNVHFSGAMAHSTVSVGSTNQLMALLSSREAYSRSPGEAFPEFLPTGREGEAIEAYLKSRGERELAQRGRLGANRRQIENYLSSLERSQMLRGHADDFGSRGQSLGIAAQAAIALSAVKSGLTRVVLLQDRANWDTHASLTSQGPLMEGVFFGLESLIDGLAESPGNRSGNTLLDESLVVVLSEMSRTPYTALTGGKDHWPYTTVLLVGPQVKSRRFGGSNDNLIGLDVDFASGDVASDGRALMAENLLAGILHGAGVDTHAWLQGVDPFNPIWRPDA